MAKDSQGSRSAGATDLDGHFVVNHVREGTYYVIAALQGYLNPVSDLSMSTVAGMSDEERKALESRMTKVTVATGQTAEASVRLERAAEIDGTVQFDDGSPAIGLKIVLKRKSEVTGKDASELPILAITENEDQHNRLTDDHGHFRILGVSPGEYVVGVDAPIDTAGPQDTNPYVLAMQSMGSDALTVYAGNTTRASAAKVVKIESSDDIKDADITIPLAKLHTVRGHVVLKSTNQAPSAAFVELRYADTHEQARISLVPGGEFELHYVPEDSYVLEAAASSDPIPSFPDVDEDGQENEGAGGLASTGGSFQFPVDLQKTDGSVESPLVVTGDVDDITIAVPDPPKRSLQSTREPAEVEQPSVEAPQ